MKDKNTSNIITGILAVILITLISWWALGEKRVEAPEETETKLNYNDSEKQKG